MNKKQYYPIDGHKIFDVLMRWGQQHPAYAITHSEAIADLLPYAIPSQEQARDWTPNIYEFIHLVDALGGSRTQRLAFLRLSMPSLSHKLKRWRADAVQYVQLEHSPQTIQSQRSMVKIRNRMRAPVTATCDYSRWVQILGYAGVLDPDTIAHVPDLRQQQNLERMRRELLEMGGVPALPENIKVPEPREARIQATPRPESGHMVGHCDIERQAFDLADKQPVTPFPTGPGLLCGYHYSGEVSGTAGRVMVNCIFTDVTFTGDLSGVMFLGCYFESCRIKQPQGHRSEGVILRSCQGMINIENQEIAGLRIHDGAELTLQTKRADLRDLYVSNGWVKCIKSALGKGGGERNAPRYLTRVYFENGGLDFDGANTTDRELFGDEEQKQYGWIRAVVAACVPADILAADEVTTHTGEAGRAQAIAMDLFGSGTTTRELCAIRWHVVA